MKSLTLLALSSLALASPHGNRHSKFFGTGAQGTGGYLPKPTGGFYPGGPGNGTFPGANSTGAGSSGAGSVPVLTKTVVPVPESPESTGTPEGGFDKPDTAENNVEVPAGAGGSDDAACSVVTETETSVQYVTVTAGSESVPSGKPEGGSNDSSVSLTGVSKPSAGEFYGRPTGGFGGGYGSASQGGEGAVPTTLATQPSGGILPTGTGSGSLPTPSSPVGGGSGSGNNTGSTPSGGKRGLSYNTPSLLSAFDGTGMSWAYNWAAKPDGELPSGIEYTPMCWGRDSIATCAEEAAGASHVLGFNEPDLQEQAGMSAQEAAEGHIKALNPLGESGASIGSPSITNGPAPMGTAYLQSWFDACGGQCKVDFVTFHWYDSAENIEYFKQHVQDVIDTAASNGVSKVWLTEFGVTGGDEATFIQEATSWLDQQPAVERYAYFMASEGKLISGGGLSAAGKAYAGTS